MPGEINCLFTKGLIPFVERDIGPDGVAHRFGTSVGKIASGSPAAVSWLTRP